MKKLLIAILLTLLPNLAWSQTKQQTAVCYNNAILVYQITTKRDEKVTKEAMIKEVTEQYKKDKLTQEHIDMAVDITNTVYKYKNISRQELVGSYYDWCLNEFKKQSQIRELHT